MTQRLFLFLTLGGITLLCCLGFWQLSRYHQTASLLAKAQNSTALSPFNASELLNQPFTKRLRFHPIRFNSLLLNDHTILLDNKIYRGQVGYDVLVPAWLNKDTLILVNRGWVPLGHSRQTLPHLNPAVDEITIEGYLDLAYRNPFIRTAHETSTVQWPLRMQQLDLTLLSRYLGKSIYPMLVNLNKESPYAFQISPPTQSWLTPERHKGYAIQWFALAATLFVLALFHYKSWKKL